MCPLQKGSTVSIEKSISVCVRRIYRVPSCLALFSCHVQMIKLFYLLAKNAFPFVSIHLLEQAFALILSNEHGMIDIRDLNRTNNVSAYFCFI